MPPRPDAPRRFHPLRRLGLPVHPLAPPELSSLSPRSTFVCGAECASLAGHWGAANIFAGVVIDTTIRRSGTGSIKIPAVGAAMGIAMPIAPNSAVVVDTFAIYFSVLPVTDANVFVAPTNDAPNHAGFAYDVATGRLAAYEQAGFASRVLGGPVLQAGVWYVVDYILDALVAGASPRIKFTVNDGAEATLIGTGAAGIYNRQPTFGQTTNTGMLAATATFTLFVDDINASITPADYPISNGWAKAGTPIETWVFGPDAANLEVDDEEDPPQWQPGLAVGPTSIETGGEFVPLISAPAAFNPAAGFDWSEQPAVWQQPTWYAPDLEDADPVLPFLTVATVAQDAALWLEQPGQEAPVTQRWEAPDAAHAPPIILAILPLDPALHPLYGDDQQQGRALPGWDRPEDAGADVLLDLAELVDQTPDVQQDRAIAQLWFSPDPDLLPFVPAPPAFDPSTGFDWSEQPQLTQPVRWLAPDPDPTPFTPAAPFNPANGFDWTETPTGQVAPPWLFADNLLGITAAPAFDPTDFPWDQVGHVDRAPEPWSYGALVDTTFIATTATPAPTTATVPEQAALWPEQPQLWRWASSREPWYNPAIDPVAGPAITGSPAAGATPVILINAENGDVFIYIGGNFIVPAS